jgi:hypothetical protein
MSFRTPAPSVRRSVTPDAGAPSERTSRPTISASAVPLPSASDVPETLVVAAAATTSVKK